MQIVASLACLAAVVVLPYSLHLKESRLLKFKSDFAPLDLRSFAIDKLFPPRIEESRFGSDYLTVWLTAKTKKTRIELPDGRRSITSLKRW